MKPYTLDQAEADLTAAYATGDPAAIAAAAEVVDKLDTRKAPVSLHAAALYYASIGLHVFPLQPGFKVPFKGSNGCKGATTEAALINAWWEGNPQANIGLATGYVIDVVDIDGPLGQHSRATEWDAIFSTIDADAVAKVSTPRPGGMHIYVPATGDGNSAGICPGVDYRGRGGYVLAPPSVIAPGGKDHPGSYRFLNADTLADFTRRAA